MALSRLLSATAPAAPWPKGFDAARVVERLQAELYRMLAAIPMLLVAGLVVWIAWRLGGWLARRRGVDRVVRRNPLLEELVASTIRGSVGLAGLVIALQLLDATAIVGAVLGTAGVLGVALGFAFKDIAENYVAGVLMSLRQPFRPDDHVRIGDNEGVVAAMTARATVLMTLDGNHLRVPNAMVFKSATLNYTRNPNRRFEFDLALAAQADAQRASERLSQALAQTPGVLADPAPEAFVIAIAADGRASLRLRAWVDQRAHDIDAVRGQALRRTAEAAAQPAEAPGCADPTAPPAAAASAQGAAQSSAPATIQRQLRESGQAQRNDLLDPSAPEE